MVLIISRDDYFVLSQGMHLTDRQKNGHRQTLLQSIAYALGCISSVHPQWKINSVLAQLHYNSHLVYTNIQEKISRLVLNNSINPVNISF